MILRRIHLACERDHRSDDSKRRLNTSDEYEYLFSHTDITATALDLSYLIYHRIEDLSLATTAIRAGSFPFTAPHFFDERSTSDQASASRPGLCGGAKTTERLKE